MTAASITTLFLDIGGVLLTNGWDREVRRRAAEVFDLDDAEMEERHHLTFDTYEEGKLCLDEYLNRVVFHRVRPFSRQEFMGFVFAQSRPYPRMIDLARGLKARHNLKVAVVSNEGREIAVHRIRRYGLTEFVDFFVVSSFVHYRKPDVDLYRVALDIAQSSPEQVAYVEDRAMFVGVARDLGIQGIHHTGFEPTRAALGALGLSLTDPCLTYRTEFGLAGPGRRTY